MTLKMGSLPKMTGSWTHFFKGHGEFTYGVVVLQGRAETYVGNVAFETRRTI